jgi:hypothetical protein
MTNKMKVFDAPKQSSNFPVSSRIIDRDGKKVIDAGDNRSAEVVEQIGSWVIARCAGRMAPGQARGGSKAKYAPTEYFLLDSTNWQEHAHATPGRGRACQTVIKEMRKIVEARTPAVTVAS